MKQPLSEDERALIIFAASNFGISSIIKRQGKCWVVGHGVFRLNSDFRTKALALDAADRLLSELLERL